MSGTMTPATGFTWKFDLSRFGDPEPEPDPVDPPEPPDPDPADDPEPDPAPDPDPEPEDVDKLGDKGQRALDRMKTERAAAKKEAADERRKSAALARQVEEFKDRERSDLEKANAKAERLADQATKATARAVAAEVRALSTGQFADPTDAAEVLMRDPSKYVDADGDIDVNAIEADLADLLERKPHWAKPEPAADPAPEAKKPKPRPDPGQGSRGTPAPADFRTASDEEFAAELAKYGVRKRY